MVTEFKIKTFTGTGKLTSKKVLVRTIGCEFIVVCNSKKLKNDIVNLLEYYDSPAEEWEAEEIEKLIINELEESE